jgi:hypothetical protein
LALLILIFITTVPNVLTGVELIPLIKHLSFPFTTM